MKFKGSKSKTDLWKVRKLLENIGYDSCLPGR